MSELLQHPWWLLLLAAVGVVAIITVILTLFSNLGEEPEHARITTVCPVDTEDFLLGMAGITNAPVQAGGSARILDNGDQFLPAILEALRGARCSINLMVYIWEPGEVSDRFFDVLVERARAGVEVRVMVDGLGGYGAPEERIRELQRAGGQWGLFHPPRLGKLTRFHKRNHRRAIIVDGHVGFTGGAAVADQWLGDAQGPGQWRDSMVEVRGCLASNLQSAFTQLWSHVTGEMLTGQAFYPHRSADQPIPGPGEPIGRHLNVVSSPSNEAHPLRRVFWLSFRSAQRNIYITNPYFVPDTIARSALMDRARAGVDVRVLVPGEHIDVRLIRWASHSYYQELLDAGVRIFEYQPTMIHHKHLVVDGFWSVVGSANLDVRSKELNQENVLGILDRGFAARVEESFLRDLERAREIDREEWSHRAWWRRAPERIARVFEEQF